MNFNDYLLKRLGNISTDKNDGSANKLNVTDDSYNVSVFSSASAQELESIDYSKILESSENEDVNEGVTDQNQKSLNSILKGFLELEDVQKAADADGDGKISTDEAKNYVQSIIGKDGDDTSFTLADIDAVMKEMGIDLEQVAEDSIEEAVKDIDNLDKEEATEEAKKADETQASQSANNASAGGGASGANRASGNSSANSAAKSTAVAAKTIDNMSLDELEAEKQTRQTEMEDKQQAVNDIHNGNNENVKAAKEDMEKAKEAYEKALKDDDKVPDELKEKQTKNTEDIEKNQSAIDKKEVDVNNKESEISAQENTVSSCESSLSSLQSSLSSLPSPSGKDEDKENDAAIASKKQSIQSQIDAKKSELDEAKAKLTEQKNQLTKLNEEKAKLEVEKGQLEQQKQQIQTEIKAKCAPETKEAMQAYNDAKTNVETVKQQELSTATADLATAKSSVKEISDKITEVKNKETAKDNSVNKFSFDFDENLSDSQKSALEKFEQNYEANKDKYEEVAEKTGVPAELVAAIHWRESSGNFETYLHNGDPLGQPTTHVPAGINYDNWEDAAVDAMSRYIDKDSLDADNLDTYYDVAEKYNGLGYRNKGVESPYVWAGTSNYSGGKYVADGVYDASAYDQQLGVAVMLKRLMS